MFPPESDSEEAARTLPTGFFLIVVTDLSEGGFFLIVVDSFFLSEGATLFRRAAKGDPEYQLFMEK